MAYGVHITNKIFNYYVLLDEQENIYASLHKMHIAFALFV